MTIERLSYRLVFNCTRFDESLRVEGERSLARAVAGEDDDATNVVRDVGENATVER